MHQSPESLNISKQRCTCWCFSIFHLIVHHDYRIHLSHRRLNQVFRTFVKLSVATDWYFYWTSYVEISCFLVSGGLLDAQKLHFVSCIRICLSEDSENSYCIRFFSVFISQFTFNFRLLFLHQGLHIGNFINEEECSLAKKKMLLVASKSSCTVNLKFFQIPVINFHIQNPIYCQISSPFVPSNSQLAVSSKCWPVQQNIFEYFFGIGVLIFGKKRNSTKMISFWKSQFSVSSGLFHPSSVSIKSFFFLMIYSTDNIRFYRVRQRMFCPQFSKCSLIRNITSFIQVLFKSPIFVKEILS